MNSESVLSNDYSDGFVLENEFVLYNFGENGFLSTMVLRGNEDFGIELPKSSSSSFRLLAGDEKGGMENEIGVYGNTAVIPKTVSFFYENGKGCELVYDNLTDTNGKATGICFTLRYMLDDNAEFLRVTSHIENKGTKYISELHLGFEGVALPVPIDLQRITIPSPSLGESAPREKYINKHDLYTVPSTIPCGMSCTWFDLSSPDVGVGIGYLNKSGMDMLGEVVGKNPDGSLRMNFRFFRYNGGFTFMNEINGPEQIYSLCPGEEFTSDEWFYGIHSKDWHTTAEFYRREYEKEFGDDFINWDRLSPKVKNADLILTDSSAWADKKNSEGVYTDYDTNGVLRHSFDEVSERLEKALGIVGVNPQNTLFVLMGTAAHWGIYKLPDYFPACPEAGGDEGFVRMVHYIRDKLGVAGTHYYAHTSFNHREADNYVQSADTGYCPRLCADYSHLGTIACIGDDNWQKMWKETIIPSFVERGADGIEFDEGFGHHFICMNPKHRHGGCAEGILKAQPNGMLDIFRECRRQFGRDSYFETEGTSDVAARLMDLWETAGIDEAEVVRYTHPDRLVTIFANTPADVFNAFVYGCPILTQVDKILDRKDIENILNFVSIRGDMRKEKPFGYPYGFKDEIGMQIEGNIKAKIYADDEGITVTYRSIDSGKSHLTVDLSVYSDIEQAVDIDIDSGKCEMGYVKIPFDGKGAYNKRSVCR